MSNYQLMFEANRLSWNKRTGVHKDYAFYNLVSFKNGKTSLTSVELNELGGVKGKTYSLGSCLHEPESLTLKYAQ